MPLPSLPACAIAPRRHAHELTKATNCEGNQQHRIEIVNDKAASPDQNPTAHTEPCADARPPQQDSNTNAWPGDPAEAGWPGSGSGPADRPHRHATQNRATPEPQCTVSPHTHINTKDDCECMYATRVKASGTAEPETHHQTQARPPNGHGRSLL